MSEWLDGHIELLDLMAKDLCRGGVKDVGRHGLSTELALRGGLLKQHRQLSYEGLAFHLEDFDVVSDLCASAHDVDSEKVRAATNHQRHPGRNVGGDHDPFLRIVKAASPWVGQS